jgi:hypothetical protein
VAADAELIALMAAGELTWGSADEAERYLARAARGFEGGEGPVPVPAERRGRMQIFLAIVRLGLPGSAATSRPSPRRRSGCSPPPRPRTPRGSGWARICGRWP